MDLARWQTAEDGAPRQRPKTTKHYAGTPYEFERLEVTVMPGGGRVKARLVMRRWPVTGEITIAIERIRLER